MEPFKRQGGRFTAYEKVVQAKNSGTSAGASLVQTITDIEGVPLDEFDEIVVYIATSQAIAGTTPTLDIYFQQCLVPDALEATDAHWDDWAKAVQITGSTGQILSWSNKSRGVALTNNTIGSAHNRGNEQAGFVAGNQFANHWGDKLRIRQVVGGTVTQAAIYDIYMKGIRYG